ncbi:hypothetical protein EOM81_09050 [bacterium]|nr:hypothetical protein [bacterium]
MKRLNTARAIRQQLAQVTNDLLEGQISESKARTIGYLCSIMLTAVEKSDLEERLVKLEKAVA